MPLPDIVACTTIARKQARRDGVKLMQYQPFELWICGVGAEGMVAASVIDDMSLEGLRCVEIDAETPETVGRCLAGERFAPKYDDPAIILADLRSEKAYVAALLVVEKVRGQCDLIVAFVAGPSPGENAGLSDAARRATASLAEGVDMLVMLSTSGRDTALTTVEAFIKGATAYAGLFLWPGLINVKYSEVRSATRSAGHALMGIGRGDTAVTAAGAALRDIGGLMAGNSRHLEPARCLLHVHAGRDLRINDYTEAVVLVRDFLPPKCDILINATLSGECTRSAEVVLIASGYGPAAHLGII